MSAITLLQTKISPPVARGDRVSRPRLIRRFSESLTHPLTLICAPAGFGKTSLITDWHEDETASGFPFAWVSVDEDDNDPTRFLVYLISALAKLGHINPDELFAMLQSPQPPP